MPPQQDPRRRGAEAAAKARELIAAARQKDPTMGPPDWRQKPNVWAVWAAQRAQKALPPEMQARTMAAGMWEDADGNEKPLIGINGVHSFLPDYLMEEFPDADLAKIPPTGESVDAEVKMARFAERQGGRLLTAASGRGVCDDCVDEMDKRNVRILTAVQHPDRPRPYRRSPSSDGPTAGRQQAPRLQPTQLPPKRNQGGPRHGPT
jgi:hypothetical protein